MNGRQSELDPGGVPRNVWVSAVPKLKVLSPKCSRYVGN
jgi:hypothetical protein